jgi:hypothetical protein
MIRAAIIATGEAGRRIIEAVAKRPGGQFAYGDRLVLSAFGGDFTAMSVCFRWAIA